MAENDRSTESFALGIIVAAILWLLLSREFSKRAGAGGRGSNAPKFASGGCGCGGGAQVNTSTGQEAQPPPSNPGISLGGQSLNQPGHGFSSSSVGPTPGGSGGAQGNGGGVSFGSAEWIPL